MKLTRRESVPLPQEVKDGGQHFNLDALWSAEAGGQTALGRAVVADFARLARVMLIAEVLYQMEHATTATGGERGHPLDLFLAMSALRLV